MEPNPPPFYWRRGDEMSGRRFRGRVISYNMAAGYGFIRRFDATETLFAHRSRIVRGFTMRQFLRPGEIVEFEILPGKRLREAMNITGQDGALLLNCFECENLNSLRRNNQQSCNSPRSNERNRNYMRNRSPARSYVVLRSNLENDRRAGNRFINSCNNERNTHSLLWRTEYPRNSPRSNNECNRNALRSNEHNWNLRRSGRNPNLNLPTSDRNRNWNSLHGRYGTSTSSNNRCERRQCVCCAALQPLPAEVGIGRRTEPVEERGKIPEHLEADCLLCAYGIINYPEYCYECDQTRAQPRAILHNLNLLEGELEIAHNGGNGKNNAENKSSDLVGHRTGPNLNDLDLANPFNCSGLNQTNHGYLQQKCRHCGCDYCRRM